MAKIDVKGTSIPVVSGDVDDYISLTDIARHKDSDHTDDIIRNWLRNRITLEFLGIWEQLNNPGFNPVEFDGNRMQAGLNSITLLSQTAIVQKKLLPADAGVQRLQGKQP